MCVTERRVYLALLAVIAAAFALRVWLATPSSTTA